MLGLALCCVVLLQSEIIVSYSQTCHAESPGLYLEIEEEPFKLLVVEMGRGGVARLVISLQKRLLSF